MGIGARDLQKRAKEPLNERFEIGTYEVYPVKCNLVNGLPPRYRGESD
jgi:hypothetical protein